VTVKHSSDGKPPEGSSSSDAITRSLVNGASKPSMGSITDPPATPVTKPNGEASDSDRILRQQLDEQSGDINSEPMTTNTTATTPAPTTTTRSMWQRRNARSAEEGIRRENTIQLSSLLAKARSIETRGRQYAARTISGLINALAEEVDDLDVEVDARNDTPFSGKHVDAIRIKFSRLGFKPLQMGGLSQAVRDADKEFTEDVTKDLTDLSCADEAFDRIDVDRSGALDIDEIALALSMAAGANDEMDERKSNVLKDLASSLVQLYDFNGDGVVDRNEYKSMVEDMAALRKSQKKSPKENEESIPETQDKKEGDGGWLSSAKQWVQDMFSQITDRRKEGDIDTEQWKAQQDDLFVDVVDDGLEVTTGEGIVDVSDSVQVMDTMAKSLGSITLSDLKIDLRRLIFGAIPILKHITPGGPLILEPFTTTVNGSFSRDDIMNSFLLDAGLRRLVARALRRRVRSFRDIIDGAVFYGRSWNMASAHAPVVEVPEVTNIEFDDDNRLIITGIARVQTRSDAPQIENAFKVRTRIGTRKEGRTIKLIEPELAFVIECPKSIEQK
jgi:CRISPR/Cas system CSM-associated protein Csm2 small subunit